MIKDTTPRTPPAVESLDEQVRRFYQRQAEEERLRLDRLVCRYVAEADRANDRVKRCEESLTLAQVECDRLRAERDRHKELLDSTKGQCEALRERAERAEARAVPVTVDEHLLMSIRSIMDRHKAEADRLTVENGELRAKVGHACTALGQAYVEGRHHGLQMNAACAALGALGFRIPQAEIPLPDKPPAFEGIRSPTAEEYRRGECHYLVASEAIPYGVLVSIDPRTGHVTHATDANDMVSCIYWKRGAVAAPDKPLEAVPDHDGAHICGIESPHGNVTLLCRHASIDILRVPIPGVPSSSPLQHFNCARGWHVASTLPRGRCGSFEPIVEVTAPPTAPEPVRVYHLNPEAPEAGDPACRAIEDPSVRCPCETGGGTGCQDNRTNCPTHFDSTGRTW